MFRDARQLDIQRTAATFEQAVGRYADQSESWYDGSAGSIDRRLSQCDRLLHSARATVSRLSIADSNRYLRVAQVLDEDRRSLEGLRHDLLTGASSREDVVGPPGWRTARRTADLDDAHRSYDPVMAGGHDPSPYTNEGPTGYNTPEDVPTPMHPSIFPQGLEEEISKPGYDPEAANAVRTDQTHQNILQRYPDLAQPGQDPEDAENAKWLAPPTPDPGIAHNVEHSNQLNMQRARGQERTDRAQKGWQQAHPPAKPAPQPGQQLSLFAGLDGVDRRWVTLQAASFVAANGDTLDDSHELATRAHHYAQVKTSTFTANRSEAICRAFVATVTTLGRESYRPSSVRTAAVDVGFDPQMMFLS